MDSVSENKPHSTVNRIQCALNEMNVFVLCILLFRKAPHFQTAALEVCFFREAVVVERSAAIAASMEEVFVQPETKMPAK